MVILTGMIERFWTLETEDGTTSSFRTLLTTMLIAATIALVLSFHALVNHLFCYPGNARAHHGRAAADRPLHRLSAVGVVPVPRFPGQKPGLRLVGNDETATCG